MTKVKTKTFAGTKVDINVDSDGKFQAYIHGERVSAFTLREMESKALKLAKRFSLAVVVPLSVLGRQWHQSKYKRGQWVSGYDVQHVTAIGFSSDGEVRFRDDRDNGNIIGKYELRSSGKIVQRLTPAQCEEYSRLAWAQKEANDALALFEKGVHVDVEQIVKDAIATAVDDPKEPAHSDTESSEEA